MMQKLYDEAKKHFNEPVLVGFDLGRVVGYAEDDEDCYLIVVMPRRGRIKVSFVGGFTFLDCLRGRHEIQSLYTPEIWDDYYRVDRDLELNGAPAEKVFIEEVQEYLTDEQLLAENGWTLECESPLEIRDDEGSFASGFAARIVLKQLRDDHRKFHWLTMKPKS